MMYIVVDIGGTTMRIAGSRDLQTLQEPAIVAAPRNYQLGLRTLHEAALAMVRGEPIEGTVIGITGVTSADHRIPLTAVHLDDWKGKPLAGDIESLVGGTVHLENDTALVGLGEAVFGAGKGAKIVAYITISTGVGGVRIVNEHIDAPVRNAEIGFQYLSFDPLTSFTDLVAGPAITEKYSVQPRDLGRDSAVWADLAKLAAVGIHNTILHWSPDRVVVGGSMVKEIGISVEQITFHLVSIMRALPETPSIVRSALGDVGGLWGGLARLRHLRREGLL
jgi:predicted NBD/HSP70 family sugar kinase